MRGYRLTRSRVLAQPILSSKAGESSSVAFDERDHWSRLRRTKRARTMLGIDLGAGKDAMTEALWCDTTYV